MENMRKKPRPRRSFTPEFKTEIVDLCQRGDRSVGQVAKDFDLTETAVREWVRQAEARRRWQRRPQGEVIFHSDRGCQYTSGSYAQLARELGVRLSVGRRGSAGTTRWPSRSSRR
ncbi:transposase [Microtetraspora malaysiensis]|uniref:transposase n=1 Tax=Microtetraspora malaysiensis TaxID=161358 RepID=UPI003D8FA567